MFAPEIGSSFLFESVNIHLTPVNRKANFSDYKGWDCVLKRVSIMLGIAQRIGNYDDNFGTVTNIGSPFVGMGVRLNRMIRFNSGVLFYQDQNSNPLITKKISKGTYFVSASLDIKLKDAFTFIGNLLK